MRALGFQTLGPQEMGLSMNKSPCRSVKRAPSAPSSGILECKHTSRACFDSRNTQKGALEREETARDFLRVISSASKRLTASACKPQDTV